MFGELNLQKYADLQCHASKNNGNATPVYGPFEKLFVSDWGHSDIHHDIVQAFYKMSIKQMTPIQQNSYSYLMNKYNTAIVGFSKGKSTSYLISIFSSIMNDNDKVKNNIVIGPKAIILSSSLGSCCILEDLSKKLLSSANNKVKVVVAYATTSIQNTIAELCNGCDVLISTPTCFYNLLHKTKLFGWLNLKHIVFDNLDLLLDNYHDNMIYFFKCVKKLKENDRKLQMISVSIKWTKNMDIFLNQLFEKWQYIFGSHLEAAHYMQIGCKIIQTKDDKLEKVLELLKKTSKCCRSVLFTSDTNELSIISSYIQKNDSNIEIILPNQLKSARMFTLQKWNKALVENKLLLICNDDMMFDFYIDNADYIIHYDIPINKETFSIRFSVLQDSNNIFTKKERNTYIFLSDSVTDMLQLPKVVEIMKLLGNGVVEPILHKHAKIINETLEKTKIKSPLCIDIQQFGHCPKQSVCHSRHILQKELDEPAVNIPKTGLAIIKVLNVYDASHISAKLLKLNCTNNLNDVKHWSNVEDNSATIDHALNTFYSNETSKIIYENPEPGDVVAIQKNIKIKKDEDNEYFRAVVIDIVNKNPMSSNVKVKLIDEGIIDVVSKMKVFVLPDDLKNLQTTTVDIFLASVKPIDLDKIWCAQANFRVKKLLEFSEDCNDTLIVKINMALGNTLWIKKLYKKKYNSSLNSDDIEAILPDLLLNIGYADVNVEHIEHLTKLSISAGIKIPLTLKKNDNNYELSLEEFMSLYKLPLPQWAHLDDTCQSVVSVNYIISHKLFFVLNTKFYDRYDDLKKKIDNYVEQKHGAKLKHIVKGAICLTQNPRTNQYGRVQIIQMHKNTLVQVLFVDLGEFYDVKINSLLTIHPNLITQLPFQAIECSLSGANKESPTEDDLDEICNYMFDITNDTLCLKVFDTISSAKFTGGNHYEVILFNKHILVNYEFDAKFSKYSDSDYISKIINLLNDEYTVDDKDIVDDKDVVDYDEHEPKCIIDPNIFENTDGMIDEQLIAIQEFLENFGMGVFGQFYKDVISQTNSSVKNELSTNETFKAIKPPEMQCDEDFTPVEPVKNAIPHIKEIKTDSAELKKASLVKKKRKLKNSHKFKSLCLTCNSNMHSIVPVCIWFQNESHIFLKFSILEIDEFSIDCSMDSIKLNVQFKDILYHFCVVSFGFIIEESLTHKMSFDGLHIKIEKLYKSKYKWPRLFKCNKRHNYVKYDTEQINEVEDFNVWIKILARIKQKALGASLNQHESDFDSSCSDYDLYDDDLEL